MSVVGVQTQVIVLPFIIIIIHQRSWNVDSLVVVQVITSSIVYCAGRPAQQYNTIYLYLTNKETNRL